MSQIRMKLLLIALNLTKKRSLKNVYFVGINDHNFSFEQIFDLDELESSDYYTRKMNCPFRIFCLINIQHYNAL